ncbi:rRNA methyltransferase 3B, mitochondrial [Megalops cyprinoides]|uniref:rRNA methyltransferase 3B, mitochondrial n=1 Tax=Megalops cyprinoides TaxID=118141 RepID=UPI0018654E2A|nr:rRNA methyltransferase 3B, mitochondrial [Megalops cyprinoides]
MGCRLLVSELSTILTVKENPGANLKRYVRALRRRPVKVLYPDDETEKQQKSKQNISKVVEQRPAHQTFAAQKKTVSESGIKNKQKVEDTGDAISKFWSNSKQGTKASADYKMPSSAFYDDLAGLRYEKAFPGDKRLARVVCVARSRKFREQQGKVLLEGRRLICDALDAGAIPQMIFFSTVERLRELPLDKLRRTSLVKVKFEEIKTWSDLVTPQGLMAIFSRPDAARLAFPSEQRGQSVPLSLICDNVRDPGNLGTILRCAAAAGCHSVLLTKGCVDVWEPKVLRAAMGAHFRLPIIPSLEWDHIPGHLPTMTTVHLADNCSVMEKDAEEAAASSPPRKAGDYGWVSTRPNPRNVQYEEYYESDSDDELDEGRLSLPVVETQLYHENWAQGHTALVIGGETHGLSVEALQLAERTDGRRLLVPMVPGVDSLNSAMAASILLFEGRRQFTLLNRESDRKTKSKMP